MKVNKTKMLQNLNLTNGLFFSQRIMLELINCGLSREKAYKIVQNNALISRKNGTVFYDNLLRDKNITKKIPENKLKKLFNFTYHTKRINVIFNRIFN